VPGSLHIRILHPRDLRFADTVRALAGWNQTPADWRRLLAHEPDGCFLSEWNDVPTGTVTTTTYGNELGWIGMMLVHPDFRRRGVATALMERALTYLRERGIACIKLDATPAGAPVYEQLGFRAEFGLDRWEKENPGTAPPPGKPRLPLPLPFDTTAFGAARGDWLAALAKEASEICIQRDASGQPTAFGLLRPGRRADYLGPATAANGSAGGAVIETLLKRLSRLTYWDIPRPNRAAVALAEAHGFRRVRPFQRMWLGSREIPGDPTRQFAIGGPETG
jgi:GNAT superfamily N-acetyltransferase